MTSIEMRTQGVERNFTDMIRVDIFRAQLTQVFWLRRTTQYGSFFKIISTIANICISDYFMFQFQQNLTVRHV